MKIPVVFRDLGFRILVTVIKIWFPPSFAEKASLTKGPVSIIDIPEESREQGVVALR